jgi:hypothetical protein
MLNKQEIMKEYVEEKFEEARVVRMKKDITIAWAAMLAQRKVVKVFWKEYKRRKDLKGLEVLKKYSAI